MNSSEQASRVIEAVRNSWPGAFETQRSADELKVLASRAAQHLAIGEAEIIDELFQEINSPAPIHSWGPDMTLVDEPKLRFLQSYWENKRRGDLLPRSNLIDALDLVPALGYVMLLEPINGCSDLRYRVYGSTIVQYSRVEMTGKCVWDIPSPLVATYFMATYLAVLERREPLYAQHSARIDKYFARWIRLILPFASSDGSVDRLLVGNVPSLR